MREFLWSVGGRGFVFAILVFLCTSGYALFDGMTWDQWLDYNKWIGPAFFAAKGVEEGITNMRMNK